jgi:hypothetical protein
MKTTAYIAIFAMMASCAIGQLLTAPTPTWKVTLKVVDDDGYPVAGAKAIVGFMGINHIDGLTDTEGIFKASHRDKSFGLGFDIIKNGYYKSHEVYDMGWSYQYNEAKWNPTITVILRKIIKPIPMYAKVEEMTVQQEDKPMGFDLEEGDWVAPYGNGLHADVFFTVHRKIISEQKYDCTWSVSFPNNGDGIVVAPPQIVDGSAFTTSRTAVESSYQPELNLHYSDTNQPANVFGYFIRVRTELNQDGSIKSALYGKIAGNFNFYAGTIAPHSGMNFTYYLNPTPNDRDVEFDPKHNLIANLKFGEGVSQP